ARAKARSKIELLRAHDAVGRADARADRVVPTPEHDDLLGVIGIAIVITIAIAIARLGERHAGAKSTEDEQAAGECDSSGLCSFHWRSLGRPWRRSRFQRRADHDVVPIRMSLQNVITPSLADALITLSLPGPL